MSCNRKPRLKCASASPGFTRAAVDCRERFPLATQLRGLKRDRRQRQSVAGIELQYLPVILERKVAPPEQHAPRGHLIVEPAL